MKKLAVLFICLFSFVAAGPWEPVLDYWFGELQPRQWFTGGPELDAQIEARFGNLLAAAERGQLQSWNQTARGQLALIILLDQFSRNVYRGTPRAFANDARARAIACDMVIEGSDQRLTPTMRVFVYLPFEHSESLSCQDQSIALFTKLAEEDPKRAGALDYAIRHRELIIRFGRFPHRNAILGRKSTPEEEEYLAQPGAGF